MTVKNFIGANAVLYFYIALGGAQAATASDASGPKLPQLDIETYASQIFWLIVTFIVLYFLVAKIAMPRIAEVLEGRQERIEDDLDKAETLKKEAYLVKVEYEKALSSAREEAHEATRRAQDEIAKHSAEVEALATDNTELEADILVPANKSASLLTLVIRIVPPSLCKKPSPFATAVVPLEVPPSIKLISAAVAVMQEACWS